MEQPRPVRIAAACGSVMLVLLIALSIRLATRSSASIAFVNDVQAQLTVPVKGARPNGTMGNPLRGEQVTVFDSVSDLAMVRDLQGRVGYVQRSALVKERPASAPDSPFVDCRVGTSESDMHGCETRADAQQDSCKSRCDKAEMHEKCADDCRAQYSVCWVTCHGEAVHPEPGLPSSAHAERGTSAHARSRCDVPLDPDPGAGHEPHRDESHQQAQDRKKTDKKHKD